MFVHQYIGFCLFPLDPRFDPVSGLDINSENKDLKLNSYKCASETGKYVSTVLVSDTEREV